jgi:hypothetical protein
VKTLRALGQGDPRRLLALYVVFSALTIVWTATIDGSPHFADGGNGSLGQAILIEVLIVAFLVRHSRVAWAIALFFSAFGAGMSPVVVAIDPTQNVVKPLVLTLLYLAMLTVLMTPSVQKWVRNERAGRAATGH